MNITKYLNNTALLEEYLGKDADFGTPMYADETEIPVRIDGERKYYMREDTTMAISDLQYISTTPIKVQDKINGQIVESVSIMYNFDGSVNHYEAYMMR